MTWSLKLKLGNEVKQNHMERVKMRYWRGCLITLVGRNETTKLELPRAWEPLDTSKPSQVSEGSSSHGLFLDGDKTR